MPIYVLGMQVIVDHILLLDLERQQENFAKEFCHSSFTQNFFHLHFFVPTLLPLMKTLVVTLHLNPCAWVDLLSVPSPKISLPLISILMVDPHTNFVFLGYP